MFLFMPKSGPKKRLLLNPKSQELAYMSLAAFSPRTISAVQQIRKMRGGSQPHLMRADDGAFWIVKFHNNPQHFRVLANEFFASRIGSYLGLPIPEVAVIDVSEWLIEHTPEMRVDVAGR